MSVRKKGHKAYIYYIRGTTDHTDQEHGIYAIMQPVNSIASCLRLVKAEWTLTYTIYPALVGKHTLDRLIFTYLHGFLNT